MRPGIRLTLIISGLLSILLIATPAAAATDPVINEFVFNHIGTDTNEYVELFGAASTDYSALTLLQIEGDGTGAGVIDSVISAGTTDSGGYWWTGFLSNVFENGSVTLLLVEGFSGAVGNDLDSNNDGVLDATPWTRIVDAVGVSDGGATDRVYSSVVLAPGFDGNSFTPGGASRYPNGIDTDSVADWTRNDFDMAGVPGFPGTYDPGEALNTPGAVNMLTVAEFNVVINEIDYDQPGTDAAEFIELRNNGSVPADLSSAVVELVNGTGGGAALYGTIALPAVSLAPGDYFVICGNAANVVNCDLDVFPDTNLIQNGAPDAVGLRNAGTLVDAVSYEGNSGAPYFEGSGVGLADDGSTAYQGISRFPDGVDTNVNNVDFRLACITPGAANTSAVTGCEPVTAAFIHTIQGSGTSVTGPGPFEVEAIVVGVYPQLSGFFIQEEDADADGDIATSEGIFVFCSGCPTPVSVGDQVRVIGQASEFFGMSQLVATSASAVAVLSSGNPLPAPTLIDLPVVGDVNTFYEQFEGMLVTFADTLTVSEYFELARYGQVVLYEGGRPAQYTHLDDTPTSGEWAAHLDDLSRRRVILDDDDNIQNSPLPAGVFYHPQPGGFSIGAQGVNFFRGADMVSNLTGILHWSFAGQSGTDAWRIRPVDPAYTATFSVANPRPFTPPDVGGPIKVASFNVLNYFTGIDTGPDTCGPLGLDDCRGADSTDEFDQQAAKIVAALLGINADVVGLMELENNGIAIADLVSKLNAAAGPGTYDYINTGTVGTDAITVGIIYKPATVDLIGSYVVLDSPAFTDPNNLGSQQSRPAVAQTFALEGSDHAFTVVVNHLKSKGSACGAGDDDTTTGQGNCNLTRTLGAQELVRWLSTDPTNTAAALGAPVTDILIIGDLNSYAGEDPIDAIKAGFGGITYTDLLGGPGSAQYTYLFDGQVGYLDYALSSDSLLARITGVGVWHINADEVPVFDYNNYVDDGGGESSFEAKPTGNPLYEANAFRASDHDPVIVGLDLNFAPVCSGAYPSVNSLWPVNHQFVPVEILGAIDPDGDAVSIAITSIFQDEPVNSPADGNTAPDGQGIGTPVAEVRAERDARANGRVYHISFTANDGLGGTCSGTVQVGVPLNKGANTPPPVDDGPLFDSTAILPQ